MKQQLWPELEKLGEAKVRHLLAIQFYRGTARFYAEEWLRSKEFGALRRELLRRHKIPTGSGTRAAAIAAGAIALTAFVAHWSLLG